MKQLELDFSRIIKKMPEEQEDQPDLPEGGKPEDQEDQPDLPEGWNPGWPCHHIGVGAPLEQINSRACVDGIQTMLLPPEVMGLIVPTQ